MTVRTGPCQWSPDYSCCPAYDDASPELRELAEGVATEILWRLTGRRFGLCETKLRPCRQSCADSWRQDWHGAPGAPWTPYLDGGQWYNAVCGKCRSDCSCGELCELLLPGPVHQVTAVKLGGVTLPPAGYQVHDHRSLVRLGGECWPGCQDLTADPDDPAGDAFEVTYLQGVPVPAAGRFAAGMYACEILKSCTGSSGCRLPKRVQRITREGVTLDFLDPMSFLDEGLTGLPEVDVWIRSVNPDRLRGRSSVWSVDRMPPRTVTG